MVYVLGHALSNGILVPQFRLLSCDCNHGAVCVVAIFNEYRHGPTPTIPPPNMPALMIAIFGHIVGPAIHRFMHVIYACVAS